MLHVLTRDNWHSKQDLLDGMFRLRYTVLYEVMGWKECYSPDGRERDESDHDDTLYLIATHPEIPGVAGCLRMAPSTTPNLSASHFASLFQFSPLTQDPNVYDGSRVVVDSATKDLGKPNPVATQLFIGWMEATHILGIEGCTAIIDSKRFQASVSRGWSMIPMGPAAQVNGDEVVPIKLIATPELVASIRAVRKDDDIAISEEGAQTLLAFHRNYLQRYAAKRAAA